MHARQHGQCLTPPSCLCFILRLGFVWSCSVGLQCYVKKELAGCNQVVVYFNRDFVFTAEQCNFDWACTFVSAFICRSVIRFGGCAKVDAGMKWKLTIRPPAEANDAFNNSLFQKHLLYIWMTFDWFQCTISLFCGQKWLNEWMNWTSIVRMHLSDLAPTPLPTECPRCVASTPPCAPPSGLCQHHVPCMPEGGHSTHTLEGSDPHPWGLPQARPGSGGGNSNW